jgi:DNA-binding NarL/FixJ family response regulator
MDIKIMLVYDHKMVTEALGKLLSGEPGIAVVAQAYDCGTALRLAKETVPEVVVMAMRMMEVDGFEACRHILKKVPRCQIIALSQNTDRRNVVNAFRAGARGYVLIESGFEVLVEAIRSVSGNNGYMDPNINDAVVYEQPQDLDKPGNFHGQTVFSSRKQQLLQLMAEGNKTREIACALEINHKTVEAHRRSIIKKLGLGSVEDLNRHLNEMGVQNAQPALSPREREVIKFIAEGRNIKEIAFDLDISPKTVETHRRRIMQKLKLKRDADLTRYAIREQIISL